jgi:peroxiredoxin Q/BCP
VIYGVSFDTAEENKAFSEKFHFNFPLLCDTDRTMGLAYGAADEAGTGGFAKRVGVVIDPTGTIKEYLPKVDATAYPSEVLARI